MFFNYICNYCYCYSYNYCDCYNIKDNKYVIEGILDYFNLKGDFIKIIYFW